MLSTEDSKMLLRDPMKLALFMISNEDSKMFLSDSRELVTVYAIQ